MFQSTISVHLKSYFLLFQIFIFSIQNHISLADPISPIENARDANENEFPFLASVGNKHSPVNDLNHFCTGALISKQFILTADHCFKDEEGEVVETPENLQVKVNALSLDQTPTHFDVKDWISYDEWAAKNNKQINHNDIAIVMLTEEVKGVQSGQLSDIKRSSLNGKPVIIIGYGGTDDTGPSDKLQLAIVKVLVQSECIAKYRKLTNSNSIPTNDHFCTQGSPNKAILQNGDSGSPVLDIDKNIIGVSSYTTPGPDTEAVNMHLTIEDHRDFIEDVTKHPEKYF